MNIQFITSITKGYWNQTAQYCIPTWNLPGEVVIYIDQKEGELDWISEVPYSKKLLYVPSLDVHDAIDDRTKVRKFWGKSSAQLHAVFNRSTDTRIVWIDADMEQTEKELPEDLFTWDFEEVVALSKSNDVSEDCWESGFVVFNHNHEKINLCMRHYEKLWNDPAELLNMFRPYDAHVLGALAKKKSYYNLVHTPCENRDAIKNGRFGEFFTHHINKKNKEILKERMTNA